MKFPKYILLAVMIVCLTACAKLQVSVDVLDADILTIRNVMPDILVQDKQYINQTILEFKTAHQRPYLAQEEQLRAQVEKLQAAGNERGAAQKGGFADELSVGFSTLISPYYDNRKADWLATVNAIRDKFDSYEGEADMIKKKARQRSLIIQIMSLGSLKSNIIKFRQDDLDEQAESGDISPEIIAKSANLLASTKRQLFITGGIEHSPFLFDVVNAPENDWAKYYDQSFGAGYFGNTDIAIKALDGPGNFTVKGLSFNPSDVANAAAKVTTQTVVLAAQIAGVPVNLSGTPTGNGAALAAASGPISAAIDSSEQIKISVNNQREALILLAQAILAEQENITDDDQREAALKAILAVYESQKSRMTLMPAMEVD